MTENTKDTTRAIRRENRRRKDRRPFTKAAHVTLAYKAYKRPAPGALTNALTKED
jgi:2'-5' RNA ligase